MAKGAQSIRDLLPSVWRPEPNADGLMADLISASGRTLDIARIDAGNVMQSHWSRFADFAPISPYSAAFRKTAGLPVLLPNDPAVDDYPYIDDLARLAGLLALAPYTDPVSSRERVEDFRRRLLGTVALWRGGVATRSAILQSARLALSGTDERAVGIEEFAPGVMLSQNIKARGVPEGMVGPLMRWQVQSLSLRPVPSEVYIEGVTPKNGKIDATSRPLIEQFSPEDGTGIGILYDGDLASGVVLALRPSFTSWLGSDTGLKEATSRPTDTPANPTAPGPWSDTVGGPSGTVMDFALGADGMLWAAVQSTDGELWRRGADGWSLVQAGLPAVHALLAAGDFILLGHENGLSRLKLFEPAAALVPDPTSATNPAVHALIQAADQTRWAATATGAARVNSDGTLAALGPGLNPETETPLLTVMADADGIIHWGGTLGIFRFDRSNDTWHVFSGQSLDETEPDWVSWSPTTDPLPQDTAIFLPPVTALARGPDTRLWIGTSSGLAVWGADRIRNTYATRLRALPALGDGPINSISIDERQRIWVGTERGLIVHDGFDWFEESAASNLVRLARLDPEPTESGWRFDRAGETWDYNTATDRIGFQSQSPALITSDNAAVHAVYWTDGTDAQLGSEENGIFVADVGAIPADIILRVKPRPDQIFEGGIPALPRLQSGRSDWRYLTREEAEPPTPTAFPAWTREGRLLSPPNEHDAPFEGRYLSKGERAILDQVFAYNPAAKVRFAWKPHAPFSITVRLDKPTPDETLPGAVLDRIHDATNRVRPAGARVRLAFGEQIMRGDDNG